MYSKKLLLARRIFCRLNFGFAVALRRQPFRLKGNCARLHQKPVHESIFMNGSADFHSEASGATSCDIAHTASCIRV